MTQLQRQRTQDVARRHAQSKHYRLLRVHAHLARRQSLRVRRRFDLLQHDHQPREVSVDAVCAQNDPQKQLRRHHHEPGRER